MRYLIFIITYFFISSSVSAQSAFWTLDLETNHKLDRLEIRSGKFSNDIHSNIKPLARNEISKFLDSLKSDSAFSKQDKANLRFFKEDLFDDLNAISAKSNKSRILYPRPAGAMVFAQKSFSLVVNPVFNFGVGSDGAYNDLPGKDILINTRGIEVRGNISRKLGFYTSITENIIENPNFLVNYRNATQGYPYTGQVKIANDDSLKLKVDYFASIAYIRYQVLKKLSLTFGHDRNFIGSGIRSMILSDFSAPYLNMKMDLKLGRFQFLNLLAQMTNSQPRIGFNEAVPPKYLVFHHLNMNITPNINLGLFESVVFGDRKYGFDLNYLNPIIFYRFVEINQGSPDNPTLGMDFNAIALKRFKLYGQFVLDEYNKKEYNKDNSWLKKFAWQLGFKYIDVANIKNLDLQVEHNLARPYTYSHFSTFSNYVNYNLPLAHPLGSNFRETIFVAHYQYNPKLYISLTSMLASKGEDIAGVNYGGNIKRNYLDNIKSKYGNVIGQGFTNNIQNTELSISYMAYHNLFLLLTYQARKDSYISQPMENYVKFGLRWNHPNRQFLF